GLNRKSGCWPEIRPRLRLQTQAGILARGSNPGRSAETARMPRLSRRARGSSAARLAVASPLRSSARMHLSRFVVAYHDVRPGEHVLYSVRHDRYVVIDSATLEAIDLWSTGRSPA